MTVTLTGSGAARLQRNWDSRAACNFIGGGSGTGLLLAGAAAFATGWPYIAAGILAAALIGFGLSMVWLEIGRPLTSKSAPTSLRSASPPNARSAPIPSTPALRVG